jgi:nucleoid DNA-binding protein
VALKEKNTLVLIGLGTFEVDKNARKEKKGEVCFYTVSVSQILKRSNQGIIPFLIEARPGAT